MTLKTYKMAVIFIFLRISLSLTQITYTRKTLYIHHKALLLFVWPIISFFIIIVWWKKYAQVYFESCCTQNCISNDRLLFCFWFGINVSLWNKTNTKNQLPKSLLPYALKSDAINKTTFASLSPTFITNSLQLPRVPMGNPNSMNFLQTKIIFTKCMLSCHFSMRTPY